MMQGWATLTPRTEVIIADIARDLGGLALQEFHPQAAFLSSFPRRCDACFKSFDRRGALMAHINVTLWLLEEAGSTVEAYHAPARFATVLRTCNGLPVHAGARLDSMRHKNK